MKDTKDEHLKEISSLQEQLKVLQKSLKKEKLENAAYKLSSNFINEAMKVASLAYWEYDVNRDEFIFNDNFYAIFKTTAKEEGGYVLSSSEYARRFVHPDDAYMVNVKSAKLLKLMFLTLPET
jgi:hypothetical protein